MSQFLDDQIVSMYDEFMTRQINLQKLSNMHAAAISLKLNSDPTFKNMKRVVNSHNLAVNRIKKRYGSSILKELSYKELYNEVFNPTK